MISTLPGVPSWGAVLLAVTFTAIGFAFDAGSGVRELTVAFAGAYVIGCVAAVLTVRQSGVFTAVIQPPLILFVSVPGAYFLFHGGEVGGLKDLAINCGYPLIERFPLMFFTSATVLFLGLIRWYIGMSTRRHAPAAEAAAAEPADGPFAAVTAKISALLTRGSDEPDEEEAPTRRTRAHSIDRGAKTAKATAKPPTKAARSTKSGRSTARTGRTEVPTARTRSGRPVKRTQPSRSRHTRPPETEIIEPIAERPRRPRGSRRTDEPMIPPPEPRRRSRSSSTREPREREPRKQPPPAERRSNRHTRLDGFAPFEPHGTSGSNGNGSNGNGGRNGTHHPVSRVRYRGADDGDRPQYRSRPRTAKHRAENWEFDV